MPIDWSVRMERLLRTGLVAALLLGTGCSSNGGFLGTNYNPKGNITITNAATGAVITSTEAQPYEETGSSFSIGITETNFGGPYTVSISGWTSGASEPCYAATAINTTSQTNVIQFLPTNASPPATTPVVCPGGNKDEETVEINDGKGHSVNFFFDYKTATFSQ